MVSSELPNQTVSGSTFTSIKNNLQLKNGLSQRNNVLYLNKESISSRKQTDHEQAMIGHVSSDLQSILWTFTVYLTKTSRPLPAGVWRGRNIRADNMEPIPFIIPFRTAAGAFITAGLSFNQNHA